MPKRPSRIDLLELDIDLRLADLWREAAEIDEWNLDVVAAFMRAASPEGARVRPSHRQGLRRGLPRVGRTAAQEGGRSAARPRAAFGRSRSEGPCPWLTAPTAAPGCRRTGASAPSAAFEPRSRTTPPPSRRFRLTRPDASLCTRSP